MKRPKDPRHFIKHPGYAGGKPALDDFIKQNLQYPAEALEKCIEGTVTVAFDLDHKGKVVKAAIKSGLGHGCDEEALRIVRLLRYSSLKHRGVRVTFHKTIGIQFRLPQRDEAIQVNYRFKPSEKVVAPGNSEPKNPGAGYTITFKPKS